MIAAHPGQRSNRHTMLRSDIGWNETNAMGPKIRSAAGGVNREPVAVIGCESAALTGALTLLLYTKEVYLICEKMQGSDALAERIRESAVQIYEGRKVKEILGKDTLNGLLFDDGSTLAVKGVFIELGAKGVVELAGNLGVALDSDSMKYIDTNKKQETNIEGVYAAGDCAQVYHPNIRDYWVSIGHDNAVALGRIAAENLVGGKTRAEAPMQGILTVQGIRVNTSWWMDF